MTTAPLTVIHSRDNAFVKDLRRLAQDSTAYRKQGRVWLEGDHLCRAAMARGLRAAVAVYSESFWPLAQVEYAQAAIKNIVSIFTVRTDAHSHPAHRLARGTMAHA